MVQASQLGDGKAGIWFQSLLFPAPCHLSLAVPGGIAAESLTFTPLEDMIFLKWEEPQEPNGLITQYEVGWALVDGGPTGWRGQCVGWENRGDHWSSFSCGWGPYPMGDGGPEGRRQRYPEAWAEGTHGSPKPPPLPSHFPGSPEP